MATRADPKVTKAQLTCTVCLDYFKEPKVLPCCHTFCKSCLDRLGEESKEKGTITCPQCRIEHKLPERGTVGFLTDFTVALELEQTQLHTKSQQNKATCEGCETADPVVSYCSDCQAFLCEFCSSAHKRIKLCSSHRVSPLDSIGQELVAQKKPRSIPCPKHPDEPLKLYCKTCQSLICCECVVITHQSHTLGSINKETVQEVQADISSAADEAKQKLAEFEENLVYTKKLEELVVSRPEELNSAINGSIDSLIAVLQSRRAQLLKEADETHNKELKEVWAQKEHNETTVVGLTSVLHFTDRALRCTSDIEFLSLGSQVLARLTELNGTTWNSGVAQKIQFSSLNFVQGNHPHAYLQQIGKLEKHSNSVEFAVRGLPANIDLGKKIEFKLVAQMKASKKPLYLIPTKLEIAVHGGKAGRTVAKLYVTRNDDGTWTVPFTPVCGGVNTVVVSRHRFTRQVFKFQTNVVGRPKDGALVCKGPDWKYSDELKEFGTVDDNRESGPSLTVICNETAYAFRWSDDGYYDVQLGNTVE